MDVRIVYFLVLRTFLVFIFGIGASFQIEVLVWGMLFFIAFALSSGWVYYYAFKCIDKKLFHGIIISIIAFIIDYLFSMKFMNGSKEYGPSLFYAISGVALFYLIYFFSKRRKVEI